MRMLMKVGGDPARNEGDATQAVSRSSHPDAKIPKRGTRPGLRHIQLVRTGPAAACRIVGDLWARTIAKVAAIVVVYGARLSAMSLLLLGYIPDEDLIVGTKLTVAEVVCTSRA